MRTIFVTIALLLVTVPAMAQTVIPIRYRVTRTAPGQATLQHVFLKSAMACNLAVAAPVSGAVRIEDPERASRDCEWRDQAGAIFAGRLREVEYTFTIAGQANDIDPYGPESSAVRLTLPRIPRIPPAPGNPRITPPPGAQTIAVMGTVLQRGPAFGLDVATTSLDGIPNFAFYFGGATLTAGPYAVAAGDRFVLQLWKP